MKLFLIFVLACSGSAAVLGQTPVDKQPPAITFWVDDSTGLTWFGKDNGADISWGAALKYCKKHSLAGYRDWRMPNMDELQRIYDEKLQSPGLMGAKMYHNVSAATWHVKGNLFLSGNQWTTLRGGHHGKPSGYAYEFDFNEGKSDAYPVGWPYPYVGMRVICVRGENAFPPSWQEGQTK